MLGFGRKREREIGRQTEESLSVTEVEIRTYTGHKPFNFSKWDVLTVDLKPTDTQYLPFQSYSAAIEHPANSDILYATKIRYF